MRLFGDRKTRRRNLLLVILPFIIIAIVCSVLAVKSAKQIADNASGVTHDDKSSIEDMDYHLRSDATELQTQLFNDLDAAIKSGDSFEISKLIAENFVADFYTWTNKDGSADVGGMYYVYPHVKGSVYKQARDSFYKYVTYYINTYGKDNLLEVETVTAEAGTEVNTYEYKGKSFESYFVICDWTYKAGSDIDTSELVTREYFTVIFDTEDNRYEIVQAYGDY